jgi:hypothetical protein
LSLVRDGLNLGFVGTFAVLAGLAMALYAKNLFVALLVLHVATFAFGYCCLIAFLRHPTMPWFVGGVRARSLAVFEKAARAPHISAARGAPSMALLGRRIRQKIFLPHSVISTPHPSECPFCAAF